MTHTHHKNNKYFDYKMSESVALRGASTRALQATVDPLVLLAIVAILALVVLVAAGVFLYTQEQKENKKGDKTDLELKLEKAKLKED